MVKIRAFRYRSALLLCLTLLTGCPGRGDYYRFDETVTVSTRGDNVCFSVPEPEDYQPVSVSIAPRGTRFRERQITSEPSLRIVNGQLCIPPSFCLFPDKGQFIVRSVLHSECDKDTPRIMVAGIEIADGCIFDIPLNDMEVVRPYGELKSSNVQTDQSERHGPCKYPFRAVRGVINHESH
ncbi:putative T6SS immunity periplasmic lipoprotein [Escherichia coli]|uniref:putative T6SS immunity periplasmic lipoprotein n=1 Tax=Escherichia coli TaxID=562 RepID=UPI0009852F39|nr:type VI secretion protein [Escherichia coli]EFB1246595.1 type VI secretion protein [Escherichia coli]EFB3089183.1 type VI secretion protein [Escherichia coli]EFO0941240.1 type VI secretion protein [Escherichia coli]EGD9825514.1 type VI secretion protein [Escherichia coli]